eukprot:1455685-Rhodomonas_salina.1
MMDCKKYSVEELLSFKALANNVQLDFDPANYDPSADDAEEEEIVEDAAPQNDDVIRFRKNPVGGNEVKFHMDKDVPLNHVVHVYNLSNAVEWPHLTSFCKKTIGIKAFDIRMMRRATPAEARIIFHSAEDAKEFLSRITPETKLKGKVAKFVLETSAPRGSSTNHSKTSPDASTRRPDIPSAVVWNGQKKQRKLSQDFSSLEEAAVQDAVGELEDDDCCGKAKQQAGGASLVASAVVVAAELTGVSEVKAPAPIATAGAAKKPAQGGRRGGQQGNRGPRKSQSAGAAASLTGICVDHMPVDINVY